jgi:hypothetical protein
MKLLARVSAGALAVSLLVLVHCSSPSNSADGEDAGGGPSPGPTGDAAPILPADAAGADGSSPDANNGDASGCAAGCPKPPVGAVKCGSGTIDPVKAAAACTTLDPPADLHVGAAKECTAFSITSGHYEVWCGGASLYVWASFDALTSADVATCPISAPLPDGGVLMGSYYKLEWDPDYANSVIYFKGTGAGGMQRHQGGHASNNQTKSATSWSGSLAFDGTVTTSGPPPAKGTGTAYFSTVKGSCNSGAPTSPEAIVLAAPVTWGM